MQAAPPLVPRLTLSSSGRKPTPLESVLLLLLLVVGAVGMVHSGEVSLRHPLRQSPPVVLRDFVTLDAGAACLRERCSPYDTKALDRVLAERGLPSAGEWNTRLPLYPPTTLVLLLPFTFLSVSSASLAMWVLIALLMVGSCVVSFLCLPALQEVPVLWRGLLVALFLASEPVRFLLNSGNLTALAVPLLLFCCVDDAASRRNLRVGLFCLACVLKPTTALPFLLPLLVKPADGRRFVLRSLAVLAVFTGSVLAWCSLHPATASWVADLERELALGGSPGYTMNLTSRLGLDPMLHLEYVTAYWIAQPAARVLLTRIVLLALAAVLAVGAVRVWKRYSRFNYLLLVSATAMFALLPVYHRSYDIALCIVLMPWTLLAFHRRKDLPAATAAACVFLQSLVYWGLRVRRTAVNESPFAPHSAVDFLAMRHDSLIVLAVTIVFLATLLIATREGSNGSAARKA